MDTLIGLGVAVLITVLFGPMIWRAIRGAPGRAQARKLGVPGVAEILSIERTGLTINDQPEVAFELRLSLPDGRTILAKTAEVVDILQLPRIQPGNRIAVQYDPADPSIVAVRLDRAPDEALPAARASSDEPISVTGAQIERPLWTFGHGDAVGWLFDRRTSGGVVIVDFCDPHETAGRQERHWIVDSALYLVAEAIWARTDLAATAAPLVDPERRKLVDPTGELPSYDDLIPFVRSLDPQPSVVVWGAGEPGEEVTLKLRVLADESERTLKVPLGDIGEVTIDLLVGKGLCHRKPPPSWYGPPSARSLPCYAMLHHNLQLQVLADAKNAALPQLDDELQHMIVDFALDAITELSECGGQIAIIAATTAVYAARAGKLRDDDRQRALELLGGIEDEDHPAYRLSPHWLRMLGDPERAQQRLEKLCARAEPAASPYRNDGTYAAWLASLPIE